jgi:hypothetical protein
MYIVHTFVGNVEPVLLAALLLFVHELSFEHIGKAEPEFVHLSRSRGIDSYSGGPLYDNPI